MGRAFEYRKAAKLKRWGHMAKTFTRLGKQIAIAVKAGGPEPENNPTLRSVIATCKRENMPKDNIERAIKNAMGKDQSDYKSMTYEGYGPHGIAAVSYTHLVLRRESWYRFFLFARNDILIYKIFCYYSFVIQNFFCNFASNK